MSALYTAAPHSRVGLNNAPRSRSGLNSAPRSRVGIEPRAALASVEQRAARAC
jgi:hypothetical protein